MQCQEGGGGPTYMCAYLCIHRRYNGDWVEEETGDD